MHSQVSYSFPKYSRTLSTHRNGLQLVIQPSPFSCLFPPSSTWSHPSCWFCTCPACPCSKNPFYRDLNWFPSAEEFRPWYFSPCLPNTFVWCLRAKAISKWNYWSISLHEELMTECLNTHSPSDTSCRRVDVYLLSLCHNNNFFSLNWNSCPTSCQSLWDMFYLLVLGTGRWKIPSGLEAIQWSKNCTGTGTVEEAVLLECTFSTWKKINYMKNRTKSRGAGGCRQITGICWSFCSSFLCPPTSPARCGPVPSSLLNAASLR